jgi:hypothetical protein
MDGYGKWRPPIEFIREIIVIFDMVMVIKYYYLTISILSITLRV